MEVVQGKSTDKKIVIAQEIAFAKVLAGNNKTLRDRAVKKLRKWLTIRGTGKWEFTEDEFIRIWTGLFYCMWMSDKFLVQEELAESISKLIHCFKKNSKSALLFIKCFHKRILMDWEGLDQYRIDKFNMLVRRFLRQTLIYLKEKNWEESILQKLINIFYNVILHRDNSLGFILHFISIYPEELAKVGEGKLDSKIVLTLIEPFVKLLARSKDIRIQRETEEFFNYLMRQMDPGIEFEEKFNAWKMQGYPGEGPHCMESIESLNGEDRTEKNGNELTGSSEEEEEEEENEEKVLDPRAGSVHVFLPQIPVDVEGLVALFKKHQNTRQAEPKGRKLLKSLTQKFEALGRGKFPLKIKKSSLLVEKTRKKHQTVKNAKKLLEFTRQLEEEPIKTKEFKKMADDLREEEEEEEEKEEEEEVHSETEDEECILETESKEKDIDDIYLKKGGEKQKKVISKNNAKNNKRKLEIKAKKYKNNLNEIENKKKNENPPKQSKSRKENLEKRKKNKKLKKGKLEGKSTQQILNNQFVVVTPKKKSVSSGDTKVSEKVTPVVKAGMKRKLSNSWQVQELDTNSPEYYKIETPKVITIERKIEERNFLESSTEEKQFPKNTEKKEKEKFVPIFWEKAKEKADKQSGNKNKVFMNPFAKVEEELNRTPNRRISFALERNMAQENEQYLEEVKNSPEVPFDGSKKPIQSALKSGLAPSPVNPFYRFKKIKF